MPAARTPVGSTTAAGSLQNRRQISLGDGHLFFLTTARGAQNTPNCQPGRAQILVAPVLPESSDRLAKTARGDASGRARVFSNLHWSRPPIASRSVRP